MRDRRTVLIAALLAVLALMGVSAVLPAGVPALAAEKEAPEEEPIKYGQGKQIAILDNKQITESSGLACSRRVPDVFWTHNDSGDSPRVFAFNNKGEDLATYRITGAAALDWEDIASFKIGRKAYLLLADVGDNARNRSKCTIYVVPEPPVNPRKRSLEGKVRAAGKIVFEYEDGPHDCEAAAIDPAGKVIYLVSKEAARACKVYAIPWPKSPSTRLVQAGAVATLKIPTATAMDISPDGLRAIILTYGHACEYTRKPDERWADAFARQPRWIKMPTRMQGESICYGADGKTIYLTSEKTPTPLVEVPVIRPEE